MKKTAIILILVFLSFISYSQLGADYGFNCQFNPDETFIRFKWDGGTFTTKQENGKLILTYTEDRSIFISDWADINWQKPFSIKTSLKQESCRDTKGFGILFGGTGIDNAYIFNISGNGMYTFYKYEKSKYIEIKAWTSAPHILTNNKTNIVELKQNEGVYNFYVNGVFTYSHVALPFYGMVHGYLVGGPSVILSDYYVISQKQTEKINLIDNSNDFGKKEKLGPTVNSSEDELCPVISYDERTLYVARKKASYYENKNNDDDIWYSNYLGKEGAWSEMKNIGKPLNNKSNNFVQYVSPDNNSLIVGNHYNSEGEYKSQGYSISYRNSNGWSMPKDIIIKNYYNKSRYNEICLSPDGKVMLLTAQRDETQGFKDIYVSFLHSDSSWSEPKNIGNVVNTFANETSPFIASDGVTMYFSSSGHPGYGGNDIFMTKRLDDSWTNWSKPKNLGPKINSKKWDAYYTIPASGKTAYLVQEDGTNNDVYTIKQPQSARPDPIVLIKGLVLNSETKLPMQANISYSELGSKTILGHLNSNPKTGEFMIALPRGKKYSFTANKQHFLAVHQNIDLVDLKTYEEKEIDLFLTPIKKGEKIVLNNLFFIANTSDILPESHDELDKIVELLKSNRALKIEVSGHTSKNYSKPEWNMQLSTSRANSVKNYFVGKGISETRIIAVGYGNSKPIFDGMDEATLAKNRRVELEILEH